VLVVVYSLYELGFRTRAFCVNCDNCDNCDNKDYYKCLKEKKNLHR